MLTEQLGLGEAGEHVQGAAPGGFERLPGERLPRLGRDTRWIRTVSRAWHGTSWEEGPSSLRGFELSGETKCRESGWRVGKRTGLITSVDSRQGVEWIGLRYGSHPTEQASLTELTCS
ncbi:uncharacterized protein STAUR_8336 [Stigmatella aurantiaca DW4/3-1]|uniref:Uncharacterized protein n=1 Tax=Stigmatella aurantiaca (strain DW4/3-1) TaxID=378806 RepID=E3FXW1_STIAD|nr:uncharacterized protein STAUR_8336 [Stigmatella aurantiaca DW4/3-1]